MPLKQIENKQGTLLFDPRPIVRAMAIKGYKLADVAARVGGQCSVGMVWRITNGKSVRPKYLQIVCEVLDVDIEDCYPPGTVLPPEELRPVFDPTALRAAYRKKGRSLRSLANEIGCSPQAIQQILCGKARGMGEVMPALAEVLGVDLADCRKVRTTGASPDTSK